jgi:hypothetical protein
MVFSEELFSQKKNKTYDIRRRQLSGCIYDNWMEPCAPQGPEESTRRSQNFKRRAK